MAILNYGSLNSPVYGIIRNWEDQDYWYIVATINKELIIPNEIIQSDTAIAVCTEYEAYDTIVEQIYNELVVECNISPKRIILISENVDLTDIIKTTANKLNKDFINYEWSLVSQYTIRSQTFNNKSSLTKIRPKTNSSNKYFLNFNRRWRIHRPTVVALLCALGLLDKGHVSLGPIEGMDNNWPTVIDNITNFLKKDETLIELIKDHYEEIVNLKPMYLDTTILDVSRDRMYYNDIVPHKTIQLYKDTAFSLVSETHYFENIGRYITEKTFKPISYHHPFIIINRPFSLKLLQDLGYKTFSPFIDESYDNEVDDIKRLHLIIKEVERLCKMNNDELDTFLKNIEPITEYNFIRLLTDVPNIYKKL